MENFVPSLPVILLAAMKILSAANLLAPYRFIGFVALSVDIAITFLTLFTLHALTRLFAQ